MTPIHSQFRHAPAESLAGHSGAFVNHFIGTIILCVFLSLAPAALAQKVTYGTFQDGEIVPTTAPAMNQDTPRGALKVFGASLIRQDGAALRSVIATGNDTDRRVIDTIADQWTAFVRLQDALRDTFKEVPITNAADVAIAQWAAEIDDAKETIYGDSATLRKRTGTSIVLLAVKVDGKWKVPFESALQVAFPTVYPEAYDVHLAGCRVETLVFRKAADDVKAGKYKTAQDAKGAIDQAMKQAKSDQANLAAGTRPATQPGNGTAKQLQLVKADVVCLINAGNAIYFGSLTYGIDAQFMRGKFVPPDPTKQTVVILVKSADGLIPSVQSGKAYQWRGGKDIVLLGDVDLSKDYGEILASFGPAVGNGATEQGQVPKELLK